MYHGEDPAKNAEKRYMDVAKGGMPQEIRVIKTEKSSVPIIELVQLAGFAASNGEARRHIAGKGIKINGATAEDIYMTVDIKTEAVVQFGKGRFVKIVKE